MTRAEDLERWGKAAGLGAVTIVSTMNGDPQPVIIYSSALAFAYAAKGIPGRVVFGGLRAALSRVRDWGDQMAEAIDKANDPHPRRTANVQIMELEEKLTRSYDRMQEFSDKADKLQKAVEFYKERYDELYRPKRNLQ